MLRPALRSAVIAAAIIAGGCGGPEPSGSPSGRPHIECVGIPQTPCDDAVASLQGLFTTPIVQVAVTCSVPPCTSTDGQVNIDVLLADGRRESSGYGYGSAQPGPVQVDPPVLTVVPICLGLPFATCKDMAESAAGSGPIGDARPAIGRITVRCKGVCTPLKGEGETRVDYVDGTNQVSSWGYESSGG